MLYFFDFTLSTTPLPKSKGRRVEGGYKNKIGEGVEQK